MTEKEMLHQLQALIEDSKTAVLATVSGDASPHMRWVTPALLKDHPGCVFMVTSPSFAKSKHVNDNPRVEWMFQTRALDKVANVKGHVLPVENPALQSEVLEALGARLRTFWHVNPDQHSMVVLQTLIEEVTYFLPLKGTRERVVFGGDNAG